MFLDLSGTSHPAQGLYRYSKELQLLRHVMAGVPGSGPSPAQRVCRAIEAFGAGPSSAKRWLKVAGTQKAKASDGGEDVKMASWHPEVRWRCFLPKKCYQTPSKRKGSDLPTIIFQGWHKISGIQYIMRFVGEIWKFCIEISRKKEIIWQSGSSQASPEMVRLHCLAESIWVKR